jgi:hypothetical protein
VSRHLRHADELAGLLGHIQEPEATAAEMMSALHQSRAWRLAASAPMSGS